jgi:hypothetical protein
MDMAMEMSSQLFLRNKSKTSNYIRAITFKKGEDFGAHQSLICADLPYYVNLSTAFYNF